MDEFDDAHVDNKVHIIISVKDFRAVLQHAGLTSGQLSVCYSNPGRPMKLSYTGDGLVCEFILMTVGERGNGGQPAKRSRAKGAKESQPGLEAASTRGDTESQQQPQAVKEAPAKPSTQRHPQFEIRPPPVPPSTLMSESLFVPQYDDENQWEPVNPDDDEEDEGQQARLEWDTSAQPVSSPFCVKVCLGGC